MPWISWILISILCGIIGRIITRCLSMNLIIGDYEGRGRANIWEDLIAVSPFGIIYFFVMLVILVVWALGH